MNARFELDDVIFNSIAAMHSAVNARHDQMRARLLDGLPDARPQRDRSSVSPNAWYGYARGLCALAAICAISVWLLGPSSAARAMDQLAQALDKVNSYTYRMETVHESHHDPERKVRQVTVGRWRTKPFGMHATTDVSETRGTSTAAPEMSKTLVSLEETHQAGHRGIMVDHIKKEYWWIDSQVDANSVGNPQILIYMVRQRRGRALRDLGKKDLNGQLVSGLEIEMGDADIASDLGPVAAADRNRDAATAWPWGKTKMEVWIDPNTDLPVEFHCVRQGDDFATRYRFTDLNWNVAFTDDAFDAVVPVGYQEREPR